MLAGLPDCTVMMGVPTFYTRLLADERFNRDVTANMRLFISGSAPLLPETFAAFEERTGQRILERYGMTETSMNASNLLNGERRPGSVGPALPDVWNCALWTVTINELPRGEIGDLQVKGPNVFAGYWRMGKESANEFTADGFFRTGDLALIEPDNYVTIVGRNKDMIITGGLNVYPREVESVLDGLPEVAESAVVGVPHPDFGEGVIAVVVPTGGDDLSGARNWLPACATIWPITNCRNTSSRLMPCPAMPWARCRKTACAKPMPIPLPRLKTLLSQCGKPDA